jgi:Methylpurine-DNA glycosylase (MPG)
VKYEFIRMPDSTGFGDYTESGQVIPVRFRGEDDESAMQGVRRTFRLREQMGERPRRAGFHGRERHVPIPGELDDARRLVFDGVGHAGSINVEDAKLLRRGCAMPIGKRTSTVLGPAFFERPADVVARELLGRALVRRIRGKRVALTISETEAYLGPHDLACHVARGRTTRTEVMYVSPSTLYIYFVYGLHWMLNVVTRPEGYPAAVLIRCAGGVSGPSRLTRTLGINGWSARKLRFLVAAPRGAGRS